MGTSKAQRARVQQTCQCGCGQAFMAFPVYGKRGEGLITPQFRRGHHPNCRANQTGNVPAWNAGLTKEQSASVARQGVKGESHWNYDAVLNPDFFAPDFDFMYYSRTYGNHRSKGSNKVYAKFRLAILQRDAYTCADCKMTTDSEEDADLLHVHHLEFVKHNKDRIFDPANVVTLCCVCHIKRHRVGKRRKNTTK